MSRTHTAEGVGGRFTLDTSGSVMARVPEITTRPAWCWSDLTLFQQGYIEALFASAHPSLQVERRRRFDRFLHSEVATCPDGERFSDLAPESLARIIADCEAWCATYLRPEIEAGKRERGVLFWQYVRAGRSERFPPLTPYLGDDGRVYLREASDVRQG